MLRPLVLLAAFVVTPSFLRASDDPSFAGEWKTTFGVVNLTAEGDAVTGKFGPGGRFTIKGTVKDRVLKATYKEDAAEGELTYTLDPSGSSFTGRFQLKNGRNGFWNGWRPDPKASEGPTGKFAGLWLTDVGLMSLTQDGDKVTGKYALRGGSTIEGTVKGRHLEFRYKTFGEGPGWFDLSEDGKSFTGASGSDGPGGWGGWKGRPAPEYVRHAPLVAGKTVEGSTDNLLTYSVHAPKGYKPGDGKAWPCVLILHGSNMNGRAYVDTIASAWPKLADDYLLLGINGERPSNIDPKNPQFNYTYVNFVGRSTFQGFPGTDRESPALVSEAMKELKDAYKIKHYFVGGHSQGGFLTYSLLMNYPEMLAGAFPISCGLIFQCEPSAYAEEPLKKVQRGVPLAIVHAKNDPVVDFGMGDYAAGRFGDASWTAFHFFADDRAGHMFAVLPVEKAIRWLEAMNSEDLPRVARFAEESVKAKNWRDAVTALDRGNRLAADSKDKAAREALKRVGTAIDAKSAPEGKSFAKKIQDSADASWVDGFLAYRDQFEFAKPAADAMAAYNALRARHEGPAKKLMGEARGLFQQGNRDGGYAKYQEIADKYYAASSYRDVKKALKDRK